jgi:hypothetical protein
MTTRIGGLIPWTLLRSQARPFRKGKGPGSPVVEKMRPYPGAVQGAPISNAFAGKF